MQQYQLTFLDLALKRAALRFGRFTLKSGRESPYFFNAGLFSDGESLLLLGRCYAAALAAAGIPFDMLFGPAYKGIPLATATAVALAAAHGRSVSYAFNRKEPKSHGEGGRIVGAALAGRVLIIDDVITAGTAVRDSLDLIRAAGATPVGVALALDRQERGQGPLSAAFLTNSSQLSPTTARVTAFETCQPRARGGNIHRMRTRTPYLLWIALPLLALSGAADADPNSTSHQGVAYRWVDDQGVVHYGDHVPPEYTGKDRAILNGRGVEVGHLDAQKSAEQIAAEQRAKAAALKKKE